MNADETVAATDVERWLALYKTVWEEADDRGVLSLFTSDAHYVEMPFQAPFRGHAEIAAYWRRQVVEGQRDIGFDARIVAREGRVAVAHWTVTLRQVATGRYVVTDGIFRMTFAPGGPPLLCSLFEEWWHYVETDGPCPRPA